VALDEKAVSEVAELPGTSQSSSPEPISVRTAERAPADPAGGSSALPVPACRTGRPVYSRPRTYPGRSCRRLPNHRRACAFARMLRQRGFDSSATGITRLPPHSELAYATGMWGKARFGIAVVMVLVAIATAPAVQCLGYRARNVQCHSCCHTKPAPGTAMPNCCVQSPALASESAVFPGPSVAVTAPVVDVAPLVTVSVAQSTPAPHLDTSPPLCSSILRI
jgi:hypothetical protein